ncbi:Retrotran-gag-2 domain-containing protein [Pyrenophora tritici-repentis]|nr:Retrotran-gag-2 domain-containing protein [Pyrenophora tritici-repentis]
MDNLMHNTLEEIATHVRTIELPTPAQQPETESFYEDSPPEESLAQDSEGDQPGYYQGRKIRDSYPTPPATPPPAALLARLMAGASLDEKDRQGTPKTAPWAAAFMAGTQAGKVGEYRGVAMDKAAITVKSTTAKMGSDDRYDKEPKIPKLTKENHEKWFRNNKLKLKGKGIFYTIEVTKHAYAWIARHGAGTSTSTANTSQDPAGTVNPTEQASVLGLTSDFERLGGTWNAEKAKEYDKDEAKALFYITNSLLDDDDALADEYETASALWTALKVKYSKTDQLTANNIMTKLQNFTWKDEKDVDYTWAKLKEYRRKIIAAKPAAKGLYNDEALLQIMLRALPESYGSVIDYLDVQTSLTVDEKIAALRTKELRLNDTAEHANVAFPKYRHPNDHRSSDSSMRDRPRSTSPELGPSTGCLHCKGEHWARDCKYKGEIQEFGRKLREKDERAERRAAKSKRPSRNENKKRSDKPVKPTVKTTSRRKHGYAAKNQDSDSGTDNGSSGTDSETSHESTSVETELEDESEEMEVDEVTNPVAAEPSARYHFRTRTQKRKRDTFDDMEDEHRQAKIVKAMLAVLRESRADEDPTTEIPTSTHHHEESAHETIVKAFYTVIDPLN